MPMNLLLLMVQIALLIFLAQQWHLLWNRLENQLNLLVAVLASLALVYLTCVLVLGSWGTPISHPWPASLILLVLVALSLIFLWPHPPAHVAEGVAWSFYKLLRISELLVAVLTAAVLLVLLSMLYQANRRDTIDIGPIAVPQELANRGYTPGVAAERLRDAINRIVSAAETVAKPPLFTQTSPLLAVHEVSFQPDAIAAWLGVRLGLRHPQEISGEITIDGNESEKRLCLRIRFNGRALPLMPGDPDLKRPDACGVSAGTTQDPRNLEPLFQAAAWGILEMTNPYFVSSACYPFDLETTRRLANQIVAMFQTTDQTGKEVVSEARKEVVGEAHNLLGLVYYQNADKVDARREFTEVDRVDPQSTVGFRNSGGLSYEDGLKLLQPQTNKYRDAIPSAGLSQAADELFGDAERKYNSALALHVDDAGSSLELGDAMFRRSELQAADHYKNAIKLSQEQIDRDPDNSRAYWRIGYALQRLSQLDYAKGQKEKEEAKRELVRAFAAAHRAVELQPESSDANLILMSVLAEASETRGLNEVGASPEDARAALDNLYRVDPDDRIYENPEYVQIETSLKHAIGPNPPNRKKYGHKDSCRSELGGN